MKLLAAAEAEFVENGLERAKVEGITARAGLSKGAFYLHFDGKEDAFKQLVETTLGRLGKFLEEIPQDRGPASLHAVDIDQFIELWTAKDCELFEFVWQNRGLMSLLFQGGASAEYRYLVDEFAERARLSCVESVSLGARLGLYRDDLNIELTSVFISGAYDRFARKLAQSPKKPAIEPFVRELQRLVIRGIASPVLLAHSDFQVTETSRRVRTKRAAPRRSNGLAPAK